MDVDAQASDAALPFEERDVPVRFGVLLRHTQIELARDEEDAFGGDAVEIDLVVFLRIEDLVAIEREPIPEVHIVGIRSEELALERFNDDGADPQFGEDLPVSKNHERIGNESRAGRRCLHPQCSTI